MNKNQYFKNLQIPEGKIDVVLDTDTSNEIDDQFALSYMLSYKERLNIKGIYAAPYTHPGIPADVGVAESYDEIMRILKLAECEEYIPLTFKGATAFLKNETTPVESDAVEALIKEARAHTPENPLYIVAIAAITNIASAIIKDPSICENIVIVWLGGHSIDNKLTDEYNMVNDIAAARVVISSNAPYIQLPCDGVVNSFAISFLEMEHFLKGKNPLCDFLIKRVADEIEEFLKLGTASRVI